MNEAANLIKSLKTQLTHQTIDPAEYAEKSNTIIVSAIQHAAEKVLGRTHFRGKETQKEHETQQNQHDKGNYSSVDKVILSK